jgi:glycine/D-amino acid oxidase-like deaminating enzyme/nitrite reductase/ring-hydroxylating ferredoxin subunit
MAVNNLYPSASGALTSGENLSYWVDSTKPIEYDTLKEDISTDVLVIGGGIAGLSTAYNVVRAGLKVVVVEDGLIGSGESGRTTAHITHALDDRYFDIEKVFGEEGSRKAAASHTAAIDWIENTINAENIECNFKRVEGYLFVHPSDTVDNLKKEFEAAQKAGLPVKWLDQIPGISAETGPCIQFPRQAQFHIMLYLAGLAQAITKIGGRIYTNTHATDIGKKGAVCNAFDVSASHVVVATNSPVNDLVTMHTKQIPFRTYVLGAKVPKNSVSASLWWDTGNQESKWFSAPYHYVRTEQFDENCDLLISGGEDHKTGQADDEGIPEEERFDALLKWTREHFPVAADVVYRWSGQVLEPIDHLAFIGRNPGNDNVYIITGDSGNGMTHCTIGGLVVSDLIRGIDNPWTEIYSPKRIPLKEAGTFIEQTFNMVAQYGDWVSKADITESNNLGTNEGAILGKGFHKYAVYRDDQNILHAYTARCPHLGCVVQWNASEKSFDCPCHGSRFTKEGVVINGPAIVNLKKVDIEE